MATVDRPTAGDLDQPVENNKSTGGMLGRIKQLTAGTARGVRDAIVATGRFGRKHMKKIAVGGAIAAAGTSALYTGSDLQQGGAAISNFKPPQAKSSKEYHGIVTDLADAITNGNRQEIVKAAQAAMAEAGLAQSAHAYEDALSIYEATYNAFTLLGEGAPAEEKEQLEASAAACAIGAANCADKSELDPEIALDWRAKAQPIHEKQLDAHMQDVESNNAEIAANLEEYFKGR